MSGYSLLSASALAACCVIACHAMPDGSTGADGGGSSQEAGGAPSVSGHGGSGGTAGKGGHPPKAGGDAGEGGSGGDNEGSVAGESGSPSADAGSGGATETTPSEISADAGAGPVPTRCAAKQATCAVLSEPACEFMAFADQTKTLSCGEIATVGMAQCGACGPATVELYFDGRTCWQGIPDCALADFAGKFVYPHLP
ncbi:MAG: hypothetical protein ABIQ16_05775 [Polyangiaceae bacterium]